MHIQACKMGRGGFNAIPWLLNVREEFVQLVARPFLKLLFDAALLVIGAARACHDVYVPLPME